MPRQTDDSNSKRIGRRVGYVIAVGINIALLVIANHLLAWGWFPWLTARFGDVLPFINASLAVSIATNTLYVFYDVPWFKGLGELGSLIVSLIATVRLWQVFPFDFTPYAFNWGTLTRWLLGLAIFGTCVGILVQVVQLGRMAKRAAAEAPGH